MLALSKMTLAEIAQEARDRQPITSEEIEAGLNKRRIAEIEAEIAALRAKIDQFLPIEHNSSREFREELRSKIDDLYHEKSRLNGEIAFKGAYPSVRLDVLKLRDNKGYPRFALFSQNYHSTTISNAEPFLSPGIPSTITDCYQDVVKKLSKDAKELPRKDFFKTSVKLSAILGAVAITGICIEGLQYWWLLLLSTLVGFVFGAGITTTTYSVSISAEFDSLIPDEVRTKISQARPTFGENIFILTNISGWKLNKTVLPSPDPLVLGFAYDNLWLIDSYDTTPAEKEAIDNLIN